MATATPPAARPQPAPSPPPARDGRLFATRHDLPADARGAMVDLLNQHLADLTDLRTQVKHAHWNVKGRNFYGLHLMFEAQAGRLDELADEVAERATALGGLAVGPAREVARATRLADFPLDVVDARQVVAAVADRYAAAARAARQAIDDADRAGDKGTADLFTEVSRALDKDLWFLDAHLQAEG